MRRTNIDDSIDAGIDPLVCGIVRVFVVPRLRKIRFGTVRIRGDLMKGQLYNAVYKNTPFGQTNARR